MRVTTWLTLDLLNVGKIKNERSITNNITKVLGQNDWRAPGPGSAKSFHNFENFKHSTLGKNL